MTSGMVGAALPDGPAYTVVLICHVASALVGLASVTTSVAVASRLALSRARPPSDAARRYFSPGANWAGRSLYLVPAFGIALLAMSGGAYRPSAPWVVAGAALWVASVLLGEWILWPAERAVSRGLAPAVDGSGAGEAAEEVAASPELRARCARLCWSGVGVMALVVCAMVVMVAKP